jgi:hypothetical protein
MTATKPEGPTLTEQLACAKRELALRRRVYPQFVRAGRMNPFKAQEEIALMEAVCETLKTLVEQKEQPRLL